MRGGIRLCAVHTHSTLCDGKHTPAEMARVARAAGVRSFGLSGHSHTLIPSDRGCVLPAEDGAYRAEIGALRQPYDGEMEILAGIEWDSLADVPHTGWDYWIGSVHNLLVDGRYYAIDWDREKLSACRDEAFGGDIWALVEAYYRSVATVAAEKPTILGHIDQITKFNEGGAFFDEGDPRYRRMALAALEAASPAETLLEINTGAVARGYRSVPYPPLWLLRRWRELGGRIIVTADVHDAAQMLYGYDAAEELARAAGYETACILTAHGTEEVPLGVQP